jgi:hypothetical protein
VVLAPPCSLVTVAVNLTMMTSAERDGEFVADFETEGSGLGKPQVMRIARFAAADQAGLRGHESQMGFVTQPFGLGNGQNALIYLTRDEAG